MALEAAVVGAALAIVIFGLVRLIPGIVKCLRLRTPLYLSSADISHLEAGKYYKIDYDCCFSSNYDIGGSSLTYVILRLSGSGGYVYAIDPDPAQGYWYWRDYDYFENALSSTRYTPASPHTIIGVATKDERISDMLRWVLENPETFFGVVTAPLPNTTEDTFFDYYFVRADLQQEEMHLVLWLVITLVGIAATVLAVKWAMYDQILHRDLRHFDEQNEKARQATNDFYDRKIVRRTGRRSR